MQLQCDTTGAQHTSALAPCSCAESPAACLRSISHLGWPLLRPCVQPQRLELAALQDPGHLAGADLFSDISALPAAPSSGTQPSAGASSSTHSRQQDPTASASVTELRDSSWTLSATQAASTSAATASGSLGLHTQPAQALEAAFAAAQGQHHLSVTMELKVTSPAVSVLSHTCHPQMLCAKTSSHVCFILALCPCAFGTVCVVPATHLGVLIVVVWYAKQSSVVIKPQTRCLSRDQGHLSASLTCLC